MEGIHSKHKKNCSINGTLRQTTHYIKITSLNIMETTVATDVQMHECHLRVLRINTKCIDEYI